jgi:hypothetical protein
MLIVDLGRKLAVTVTYSDNNSSLLADSQSLQNRSAVKRIAGRADCKDNAAKCSTRMAKWAGPARPGGRPTMHQTQACSGQHAGFRLPHMCCTAQPAVTHMLATTVSTICAESRFKSASIAALAAGSG